LPKLQHAISPLPFYFPVMKNRIERSEDRGFWGPAPIEEEKRKEELGIVYRGRRGYRKEWGCSAGEGGNSHSGFEFEADKVLSLFDVEVGMGLKGFCFLSPTATSVDLGPIDPFNSLRPSSPATVQSVSTAYGRVCRLYWCSCGSHWSVTEEFISRQTHYCTGSIARWCSIATGPDV
jgi:hypothetical protein